MHTNLATALDPHAPRPSVPEALLADLNPEQREAVQTLNGPLLIVAGPGSGKTRVLTQRIAALLATGTSPGSVLAVTFTNKAAMEMRHRVGHLIGTDNVNRMWIATFHSACVRILRAHHELAGLPRSFSIADAKDAARLVTDALEAAGELTDLPVPERKKLVKDVYRTISAAKNNDLAPNDLIAMGTANSRRAGHAMAAYNKALRARGAVDFDDILLLVLSILRKHPQIAEHYTARFSHVLVDEFQDTNTVQWHITKLLGGQGNVCVVGDADQSIYAFRGANPGVLNAFTTTFPGTKVVRLGKNYRSTKHIVSTAQAVIDPNPAQHRATMSTDNAAGEPVRVVGLPTDLDEARWVADQIRARGGQLGDHAVLVRTNSQTRALEMVLRERGITHDVVGTVRFFDRAEVKDALAYLRLAINPIDVGALERAVAAPRRGIGPATLADITHPVLGGRATISQALESASQGTARGSNAVRKFAAAVETVETAMATGGPSAALEAVLGPVGLADHYTGKKADSLDGAERVENLRELVRSATDFVEGKSGTDPQGRDIRALDKIEQTEAFIEYAALMSSAETPDDNGTGQLNAHAVQIATMHAAKGKEWQNVYVVGVEEGILPHSRSQSAEELAEERRLLFVAVSRAQKTLALTHVSTRRVFNDDVAAQRSRFLDDLPDDVEFSLEASTRRDSAPPRSERRSNFTTTWELPPAARGAGGWSGHAPRPVVPSTRPAQAQPVSAPAFDVTALAEGAHVEHPTFGTGRVLEVGPTMVKVRFPNTVKVLLIARAPLTIL